LQTLPIGKLTNPPQVADAIQQQVQEQPEDNWGRLHIADPVRQAARVFPEYPMQEQWNGLPSNLLAWYHGAGTPEQQEALLTQLGPNYVTLFGLDYAGGIASLYTARMDEFLVQLNNAQLPTLLGGVRPQGTTMVDLAGIRYILVDQPPPRGAFPSVSVGSQTVAVNPRAKPLCWVMNPSAIVPETPENLKEAIELRVDPGKTLILNNVESPIISPHPEEAALPVAHWHWGPDDSRVDVEVDALTDSYLIFNEQWLPGWRATINSKSVPIRRAWGIEMAVPISPGPTQVTFEYVQPGFAEGIQISILTLVLLLAAGVWWSPLGDKLRDRLAMQHGEAAKTELV